MPAAAPAEDHSPVLTVLLVGLAVFLIATFPATFLLMLFLGNVGLHLSYWGSFPLGILVSAALGTLSGRSV